MLHLVVCSYSMKREKFFTLMSFTKGKKNLCFEQLGVINGKMRDLLKIGAEIEFLLSFVEPAGNS